MGLATWTCTKYILAYCEKFLSFIFETYVCKKHLSNTDPQCQLSEIVMVMLKTYKWQRLNHIEKSWTWSNIEKRYVYTNV